MVRPLTTVVVAFTVSVSPEAEPTVTLPWRSDALETVRAEVEVMDDTARIVEVAWVEVELTLESREIEEEALVMMPTVEVGVRASRAVVSSNVFPNDAPPPPPQAEPVVDTTP